MCQCSGCVRSDTRTLLSRWNVSWTNSPRWRRKDPYQFRRAAPAEAASAPWRAGSGGAESRMGQASAERHGAGDRGALSPLAVIPRTSSRSQLRRERVRVHRMVCAIDCGQYVNPGIIAAQTEGGAIFGASAALFQELTFREWAPAADQLQYFSGDAHQ
jgi:isoquinoline 1-oxidoreductase subunit beta